MTFGELLETAWVSMTSGERLLHWAGSERRPDDGSSSGAGHPAPLLLPSPGLRSSALRLPVPHCMSAPLLGTQILLGTQMLLGCVVILVGLSGTGKGTTVDKLKAKIILAAGQLDKLIKDIEFDIEGSFFSSRAFVGTSVTQRCPSAGICGWLGSSFAAVAPAPH